MIISNCVINLSGDKDRVLAEAFRVLKPGGRFAVSDVVARGAVPEKVLRSMELWAGCVAGALHEDDYRAKLGRSGFTNVEIEMVRSYCASDAAEFLTQAGLDANELAATIDGKFISALIRASKPA